MEESNFDEIRTILRKITEKQREDEQEISRVTKIVGDIGNKFGSFTEDMAFPSMERVLRNQFGMTDVTMRYKVRRGGETMKIDVLGLANGAVNTVVIVEIKSHLKDRDIEQALRRLDRFAEFSPEHKDKNAIASSRTSTVRTKSGSRPFGRDSTRPGFTAKFLPC